LKSIFYGTKLRSTIRICCFLILIVLPFFGYVYFAQEDISELKTQVAQAISPVLNNSLAKKEDWEKELDDEIEDQDSKKKASVDSRGTNSPIQLNNQLNRSAQNLMMDVSVAVDIVGEYDKNKPKTTDNKLDIRTAEFGFTGSVDQWLRGNFLAAAHSENGTYYFEVHEAWVQLPFLPYNISLKAGSMFLDIGRLNRIHAHDRPFTKTPIVHEKLIGWESAMDTGAEMSILLPWSFLTQELVIGSTNGKKWGHAHSEGIKKNNPMFYTHLKNFYYFGNNIGSQFGFSGVRYETDQNNKNERYLYGADFTVRWNRSNLREFLFMTEYWLSVEKFATMIDYQKFTSSTAPDAKQWGYYAFLDYKFHQLWSVGYRYDFFTDKNSKNEQGLGALNFIEANSIQLTFKTSEFAYFRGSLERRYIRDESKSENTDVIDQRVYVQTVFILGSHPAHAY
jgi:hypothetical protein